MVNRVSVSTTSCADGFTAIGALGAGDTKGDPKGDSGGDSGGESEMLLILAYNTKSHYNIILLYLPHVSI